MVVTFLPATLEIAVMQERVASPLMCTVQAPQERHSQPNFVPVMSRVSRNTQSKGMSGLTSTDLGLPFKVKLMAMGTSSSQANILQQLGGYVKIRGKAGQAERRSAARIGRRRMRFPVAAKMALASAGAAAERRARRTRRAVRCWPRYGLRFSRRARRSCAGPRSRENCFCSTRPLENSDLRSSGLAFKPKIDGAFHLGFHTEWVDGRTAIDGADHAFHAKGRRLRVASDFRDLGDIASPAKRGGDYRATACRERLVPAGLFPAASSITTATAHVERTPISTGIFPAGPNARTNASPGIPITQVRTRRCMRKYLSHPQILWFKTLRSLGRDKFQLRSL